MLYFIVFFVFVLLGFLDLISINKTVRKVLFGLGILLLICLGGLRWETGTDWVNYESYFTNNKTWKDFASRAYAFEIGYKLLNYFVKVLTSEYTGLLIVLSFITIFIKSFVLYKNTRYYLIALLAYFCFLIGDIFAVRQSISISICLFSINYIIEKKRLAFLLSVLLACCFHITSILFLLAFPIFHIRLKSITIIIILIIGMGIGISGIIEKLLGPIVLLLNAVEGSENGMFSEKMDMYSKNTGMTNTISKGTVLLIGMLRRLVFIPLYLFFRKKGNQNDTRYDGFLNLFLFGNLVYFIFASSLLVMVRATVYYIVFEILLIVIIMQSIKLKTNKIILYLIILLYCFMKLYYNLNAYWDFYVPYFSIFDDFAHRKF